MNEYLLIVKALVLCVKKLVQCLCIVYLCLVYDIRISVSFKYSENDKWHITKQKKANDLKTNPIFFIRNLLIVIRKLLSYEIPLTIT